MSYSFFVPLGKWSWMWQLSLVGSFFCSSALLFPCVCPLTSTYTWRGQSASSAWRSTLPSVWDSATPGYVQSGDNGFRMIGITVTMVGMIKIKYLLLVFAVCGEQDSNMRDILGPRFLVQRGCTYDKVEYRTAILPGCSIQANPTFTYPVALSCHCGACRTESNECAHRASMDGARCTKPFRDLSSFSGQSNHMISFWLQQSACWGFLNDLGNCMIVIVCHFQIYF